jgi:hypothetical protein
MSEWRPIAVRIDRPRLRWLCRESERSSEQTKTHRVVVPGEEEMSS